ncbi:MAG: helix-turn-helix transcriptional regulator [Clostridia bacterium]|nr:helix-turn-helix transcriptional regulator [Clostridia bacterium]
MIRHYRLQSKLTQEELAEELGISWRQLQRLEHNEEKTRITTFKKIVKVLNIPDDEILRFIKSK